MRKRIYEVIEVAKENDFASACYDWFMILAIIISILPLTIKEPGAAFQIVDKICVVIFIIDYIMRLITADYKYDSHTIGSFIRYPFSFMAIIDLLSILPSFIMINKGFKLLRLLRMTRAMRVFRVFRAIRYSKSFDIIAAAIRSSKDTLLAVCVLALGYILVSALIVFNVEPDSFGNFFEAIYWATVSLTTVGYGDIYPVTATGRVITMISSFFGVAVVALPAGIITAGYMTELEKRKNINQDDTSHPHSS